MHGASLMFSTLEVQMDNCKLHFFKIEKEASGRQKYSKLQV